MDACSEYLLIGDAARTRHAGATQALPRESRELRVYWLLCANRARPWIQCAGLGDNCDMESGRQDFHNALSPFDGVKMVDRIAWENGKSCRGYGSANH